MNILPLRAKLIFLLDLSDTDYWSDVACCEARKLIDEGGEELLSLLAAEWPTWTVHRQEHLAYVLGEGPSAIELQIVVEMSKSKQA